MWKQFHGGSSAPKIAAKRRATQNAFSFLRSNCTTTKPTDCSSIYKWRDPQSLTCNQIVSKMQFWSQNVVVEFVQLKRYLFSLGSMVQNGKFSAAAIWVLVSTLKNVDLPTLGRPTMPHFKLVPRRPMMTGFSSTTSFFLGGISCNKMTFSALFWAFLDVLYVSNFDMVFGGNWSKQCLEV